MLTYGGLIKKMFVVHVINNQLPHMTKYKHSWHAPVGEPSGLQAQRKEVSTNAKPLCNRMVL
jgi:hypothetical protein